MSLPITLPDWLPWWVPIAVLLPVLLYALVFLAMPFSVIGLRGRMEALETRLDELHAEIRGLALRLPEAGRVAVYDDPPLPRRAAAREEFAVPVTPPIPPPPLYPDMRPAAAPPRRRDGEPAPYRGPRGRDGRAEPRLDWPS